MWIPPQPCRIWRKNGKLIEDLERLRWQVYRLDDFLLLELSHLSLMYQWTLTSQTRSVIIHWVLLGPAGCTQSLLTARNASDAPPREETMVFPKTSHHDSLSSRGDSVPSEGDPLIEMGIEWKQTNPRMVKRVKHTVMSAHRRSKDTTDPGFCARLRSGLESTREWTLRQPRNPTRVWTNQSYYL